MAAGDHFAHRDKRFGCLLISSPQGHSGKTTITIGLCDALRRKGLSVQPFKKGPDYIDPSWLTLAAGRICRNLDLFLIPKDRLIRLFEETCREADIAVIEGAMGLYDGIDPDGGVPGDGTTAGLSRFLKSPVLLVINSSRMTGSIAAMVTGYQHFQKDVNIAGVILNHVSGPRHEGKLRDAVERYCRIPVVGSIPKNHDFRIAERHLGLRPSGESDESGSLVERIGRSLEACLDLDKILEIARSCKAPHPRPLPGGLPAEASAQAGGKASPKPRIGVIRDRAFNFYYPENLEALSRAGAELIFIDSMRDRLPEIEGLYIGGGFPEFFLKELEENKELREDIGRAIEDGLPVYAECAGLMYLCRKIHWQGRSYEMVGTIPAEVEMLERPQGHGYVIAEVTAENPFFPVGSALRGHEFHHSRLSLLSPVEFAYQLKRGHGIRGKEDGILYKKLLASYTHLHALSSPRWAEAFVSLAFKKEPGVQLLKGGDGNYFPVDGN